MKKTQHMFFLKSFKEIMKIILGAVIVLGLAPMLSSYASAGCGDVETATKLLISAVDSPEIEKAQADYVCDGTADEIEIQAAIDALPHRGGEVRLSGGTFTLSGTIYVYGYHVTLSGNGSATLVTMDDSITEPVGNQIAVTGNYCTIRNFHLDGNGGKVKYQIPIFGKKSKPTQYNKVESMIIGGSATDGIIFGSYTSHGIATKNYLYNHNNPISIIDHTSSIEIEDGAENIIVSNNRIYNSSSGIYPHVHEGYNVIKNIIIDNNLLIKGPQSGEITGCGIFLTNEHVSDSYDITITNNILDGGRIDIIGRVNATLENNIIKNSASHINPAVRTGVSSKLIFNSNVVYNGGYYGVWVKGSGAILSGNQIYDNYLGGIWLDPGASNTIVTSNVIKNNDTLGTNGTGLNIEQSDNIIISNNQILDHKYAIKLNLGSDSCLITNNVIKGNTASTGQIRNDTMGAIIMNNIGYNAVAEPIRTITSSTTLLVTDHTVLIDCSENNVTATLPYDSVKAEPEVGTILCIKCIDGTNTCTIYGNTNNIDGSGSITLSANQTITVQWDGTEWRIISGI